MSLIKYIPPLKKTPPPNGNPRGHRRKGFFLPFLEEPKRAHSQFPILCHCTSIFLKRFFSYHHLLRFWHVALPEEVEGCPRCPQYPLFLEPSLQQPKPLHKKRVQGWVGFRYRGPSRVVKWATAPQLMQGLCHRRYDYMAAAYLNGSEVGLS